MLRSTSASSSTPTRLRDVGLLDPDAVSRLVAKCEAAGEQGVGETDEMGLVGALSVMLLHDRLVARPGLAEPAEPTRVVVGASVRGHSEPALVAEAG